MTGGASRSGAPSTPLLALPSLRAGFRSFSAVNILGWIVLFVRGCPLHRRMFAASLATTHHMPVATSFLSFENQKMSPGIPSVLQRGRVTTSGETLFCRRFLFLSRFTHPVSLLLSRLSCCCSPGPTVPSQSSESIVA